MTAAGQDGCLAAVGIHRSAGDACQCGQFVRRAAERDGRDGPGPVEKFDRDYPHVAAMLAGQDGEPDGLVLAAAGKLHTYMPWPQAEHLAGLIAPDIVADTERRVLDRCAAEHRRLADAVLRWWEDGTASPTILGSLIANARSTADRWSSSGEER